MVVADIEAEFALGVFAVEPGIFDGDAGDVYEGGLDTGKIGIVIRRLLVGGAAWRQQYKHQDEARRPYSYQYFFLFHHISIIA